MKQLQWIFFMLLVCSGIMQAQTVQVKVSPQQNRQYIEGFGTCVIDYTNPPSYFNDPKLYDLAVNDLGMSILRMSFPQEIEEVNDDADPNHFNWPGFDMTFLERRMKIALEFKKRGVEKFIFSTWSPSEFIKTNRAVVQGGFVRMDMFKEYAENVAACIIAAKHNWGIDVGAFAIQNELMFIEPYCSCLYTPETAREAVRALMRKFEKEGINCRIQMPEDMMFFNRMYHYILPTINDPETKHFVGDFCTHRQSEWDEVVKWHDAVAPLNRQTWMTETSGHQPNWDGALKLANDIYDYIVGGNMSAWLYWQISTNSASEFALMKGSEPTPKYYASKHFYRWVRPGALRIDGQSSHPNLLVSAFKHEYDGTLTLVLINKDEHDLEVQLAIEGMPNNTYEVYRSGESENCISLGKQKLTSIKIPAKHIITLYSKDLKKTKSKKDNWPETYISKYPKGEKLGNFEYVNPNGEMSALVRNRRLSDIQDYFKDRDINTETGNGWTALHYAILAGRAEVVRWLISRGADPLHKAKDGWTPLHAAAATFVGEQNEDGTPKSTKYDVFRLILEASKGARPYTKEGFSPLHVAVMNEQVAWRQSAQDGIRRIGDLIVAGFDPNEPDNMGRTSLHWASWQAATINMYINDAIVSLLVRFGANVYKEDMLGRTPLHYASEMGYAPIVKTLRQLGADPVKKDKEGKSALDLAQSREMTAIVELLTKPVVPDKATYDEPQGSGFLGEELIKATRAGQVERVKELLMRGADSTYRDNDGFNAYERARDNRNQVLMELLK
jgi:ankyrin repeat protein/O-glycosyl hydrolase